MGSLILPCLCGARVDCTRPQGAEGAAAEAQGGQPHVFIGRRSQGQVGEGASQGAVQGAAKAVD